MENQGNGWFSMLFDFYIQRFQITLSDNEKFAVYTYNIRGRVNH